MKRKIWLGATLITVILINYVGCSGKSEIEQTYPAAVNIMVSNPLTADRDEAVVIVSVDQIRTKAPANPNAFVVLAGKTELPSQAIDPNGDGEFDQIAFETNFVAREEKAITIRYAESGTMPREYPKKTQAELSHKVGGKFVNREYQGGTFQNVQYMRVPPEHTDHSWYIRYEGPGWESDKVGYRFYLDWRNAIDIFGKKTPDMVLQNVGLDGFDSYHEMSDWGMDILKVGESLGIGSLGMWQDGKANRVSVTDSVTCRIVANGPVYSQIRTKYFGWKIGDGKYDLTSDLSIKAGSRLTEHNLLISDSPANLCTGIVRLPETKLLQKSDKGSEWAYLATYGKQSLAEDNLGMAVLYKQSDLIQLTEDSLNHAIVLTPSDGKLRYYFLAAWEEEPGGIQNKAEFVQYLDDVIARLNEPLEVSL